MRDEIDYFREVELLEELPIALAVAGLAPDPKQVLDQE